MIHNENRGPVSSKGVKAKNWGVGKAKVFAKFPGRILGVSLIQRNGKADNPVSAQFLCKLEEHPTLSGARGSVYNHDAIRFHHLTDLAGLLTRNQLSTD